jgi:hypothetical protein
MRYLKVVSRLTRAGRGAPALLPATRSGGPSERRGRIEYVGTPYINTKMRLVL